MKDLLKSNRVKEFFYQGLFLVLLFFVFSLDKHNMQFHFYDLIFFSFYTIVALFISHILIPKFFYNKKLIAFWSSIICTFLAVYFIEELLLEPFLVGGDRAEHISNMFYTLLSIFPIIFMMVGFKITWDTIKKQRELKKLQASIKESELRFLKTQINPHFLFNNLNNLYSYSLENSPKTPSIILELSSVLRFMLYECKEDVVSLNKEIEHLKSFTALNELQIENRGNISFSTRNIGSGYKIAPLILIVFIENAFKHSTASQSDAISIDISIEVINNELRFICKNSFFKNTNTQNLAKGIGLSNVKKRLELIYPKAHKLEITSENNIYLVDLTLKLNK